MINDILALTRPLFILDTETTGLDVTQARIVEISFQRWGASGVTKLWSTLVNPGVPIPAAASKVHGITDATIQSCRTCGRQHDGMDDEEAAANECDGYKQWPTFKQLAANLAQGLTDCDFAGKSVRFDLRIMAAEMTRAGVEWSYMGARIIDADRLEALGEPRSLSHLYEKYTGTKLDGAHGTTADTAAAGVVIEAQLRRYTSLPRDLDKLHKEQWPGFIDPEGKFRFVDGVACFAAWGKYAGQPMTKADVGYWNFILAKDFSPDVKRLASEAKLGRFPEGT